jgi:hypothetical protein
MKKLKITRWADIQNIETYESTADLLNKCSQLFKKIKTCYD